MIPLHPAWVIAVLSLLTSVVTAHAECAWVLSSNPTANVRMVESAGPFVGDGVVMWHSWTCGSSSRRTAIRSRWKRPSDHVLLGERGVEHITYRCLPDTVEPRGPKGKCR